MLYLMFFGTITMFMYALLAFREERVARLKRRLSQFVEGEKVVVLESNTDEGEAGAGAVRRMLEFMWRHFKRYFKRRMPGEKEAAIERKLLQAGRPFQLGPVEFRLLQTTLLIAMPAVLGFYAQVLLRVSAGGVVLFVLIGVATAAFLPNMWLNKRIKRRSHYALRELPDVLDLLTVSLEAGLGFDAALSKLVSRKEGVLSVEFQRCLEEIRLGRTRREALSGVRDRLPFDEMKMLISSILQAEKMGIGMVQVLRVQSQEIRELRKSRAEEAAMKAPIKMLFPLVLFIFPCLFIILLGPAAIQFIETFSK